MWWCLVSSSTLSKHGPLKSSGVQMPVTCCLPDSPWDATKCLKGGRQEPVGTLVGFFFFLGNSGCRSPIRQKLLQTRPRFENCCFANSAFFRNNNFHSWEELKISGDPAAFFCRGGAEMWTDQVTCWGHVVHWWQHSEARVWPAVFWSPRPTHALPLAMLFLWGSPACSPSWKGHLWEKQWGEGRTLPAPAPWEWWVGPGTKREWGCHP